VQKAKISFIDEKKGFDFASAVIADRRLDRAIFRRLHFAPSIAE